MFSSWTLPNNMQHEGKIAMESIYARVLANDWAHTTRSASFCEQIIKISTRNEPVPRAHDVATRWTTWIPLQSIQALSKTVL